MISRNSTLQILYEQDIRRTCNYIHPVDVEFLFVNPPLALCQKKSLIHRFHIFIPFKSVHINKWDNIWTFLRHLFYSLKHSYNVWQFLFIFGINHLQGIIWYFYQWIEDLPAICAYSHLRAVCHNSEKPLIWFDGKPEKSYK